MAIRRDEVVSQLAAVIGDERAEEIVAETETELAVTGWSETTAERVIDRLVETRGLIGAAAKRLRSKARPVVAAPPRARAGTMTTPSSGTHRHVGSSAPTESVAFVKLTAMLGASLGESKARALVEEAARRRGLAREAFSVDDAFVVLEDLTREPGLVGTVARFAKARAHFELV